MTSLRMLIAGFGGQGVLFAGKVAVYSGLLEGREVTWLPSYGPEMRGGTAHCSVCIDEHPIGSPLVDRPQVLIALNAPSCSKFLDKVLPGGMAFVDETLVENVPEREDISVYAIPATALCVREDLEGLANLMLLSAAARETGFASLHAIESALRRLIPVSKEILLARDIRAVQFGAALSLEPQTGVRMIAQRR